EALTRQVAALRFPLPRAAFSRSAWVLEPPPVLALMAKLREGGVPLKDDAAAEPYRGVLTGFNEAFVVDQAARDRLAKEDPRSAELLKPFLRGEDIGRWAAEWQGRWMIVMPTSADHAWPWAHMDLDAAEACFQASFPAIARHLGAHRATLRAREDQGRFWWELRPCAYYAAFDAPKIVWQEIQYHPAFARDAAGLFVNNKAFLLPSSDPFLLAALNSPALWWFNWRHLARMKDEALTPQAFRMVEVPIPRPDAAAADEAATRTEACAAITRERLAAAAQLRDWYAAAWGLERPPRALAEPWALDAQGFLDALKAALPAKRRAFTSAQTRAIRAEHAASIAPMQARLAALAAHERALSALVNRAFGLTPEEVKLMWKTAPPRMPIAPEA
ncbi:MAG: hypothetical protein N3D18_13905, partial [Roseococcus sp.]|nr:hypothetical protein [Roseococcus sp.]